MVLMDLDRGTLAKIDRKMLSGLDHEESWQIVRVPVSDAMWSTWRRYCGVLGVSMGRGVGVLVAHELGALTEVDADGGAVFASELKRQLVARSEDLDARERRLDEKERSLRASQRLLRAKTIPLDRADHSRVGRNDPCPCASGFKYKRCHGN
jgi:hypothetical protein